MQEHSLDRQTPVCIIMMGPSGAGKSTWIKNNLANPDVASADSFFYDEDGQYNFDPSKLGEAHAQAMKLFIDMCQTRMPTVVCDNTNTTIAEIAPYLAVAQAYGYKVHVVALINRVYPNKHGVPEHAVSAMIKRARETLLNWPRFWPEAEVL